MEAFNVNNITGAELLAYEGEEMGNSNKSEVFLFLRVEHNVYHIVH